MTLAEFVALKKTQLDDFAESWEQNAKIDINFPMEMTEEEWHSAWEAAEEGDMEDRAWDKANKN